MDIENIRLRTIMSTRLTRSEQTHLSIIAKQSNMTKSELLRSIAVKFLIAKQKSLLINKSLQP